MDSMSMPRSDEFSRAFEIACGTVSSGFAARLAELERHRSVDVEGRMARARELEAEARSAGDEQAMMRARLIVGDMLHRIGDGTSGARTAAEVHAWAAARHVPSLLARSHLVLSSVFDGIGDAPSTLDHAVRGMDALDGTATPRERGNHLLRLADALAINGSVDEARRRYREAAEAYASIGDREFMLNVVNNQAVLESELGDPQSAAVAAELLERTVRDSEMNSDYAETLARAHLVAGDLAAAEAAVQRGLRLLTEHGATKAIATAELLLTSTEVLLAAGRVDEAQSTLDRCVAECRSRLLTGMAIAASNVQAQLHAARNEFEQAYLTHREFHAASNELRSQQNEAAARTREALFQTSEARREAERFRMQARIDPLTNLFNRRYVDETLPQLLTTVPAGAHHPVTVTIVDIDHFKQINDEWSHAVGDDVLRHLARLLELSHERNRPTRFEESYVARIGGEEFLIVDSGSALEVVAARIDRLRREVEEQDWTALAPGMQVTISAGVTEARPDDSQRTLLHRADAHLYAAKARGRNCVVATGS